MLIKSKILFFFEKSNQFQTNFNFFNFILIYIVLTILNKNNFYLKYYLKIIKMVKLFININWYFKNDFFNNFYQHYYSVINSMVKINKYSITKQAKNSYFFTII